MHLASRFLYQLLLSAVVLVLFYSYIKSHVFNRAAKLAVSLKMTKSISVEVAKGVVELPLVVLMHILFSILLVHFFVNSTLIESATLGRLVFYIIIGILLGIGMMSFSSLLCRAMIELLRHLQKPYFPREVKDWLIMTRSGWFRHYLHTIDVLPLTVGLVIVFGQICCEEMIFRGVFLHYFLPIGYYSALMTSTILFMIMQLFHMPNWVSGIFPLIGSMVIGLINGILYLKYFNLIPLIFAHFAFFVVAVL